MATAFKEKLRVSFQKAIRTNGQLFRQLLMVNPARETEPIRDTTFSTRSKKL
jgi:hypothetical protein